MAKRFYRYDHASKQHEVLKHGLEIAGYALNQPGGFVIANSGGIWLWDGADDLQSDRQPGGRSKVPDE